MAQVNAAAKRVASSNVNLVEIESRNDPREPRSTGRRRLLPGRRRRHAAVGHRDPRAAHARGRDLDTAHQERVKRALLLRGATLQEEHARSRRAVLRYEAPLARVLGLPAELARLTSGSARYWMLLSHYALVTRDPGGSAA